MGAHIRTVYINGENMTPGFYGVSLGEAKVDEAYDESVVAFARKSHEQNE